MLVRSFRRTIVWRATPPDSTMACVVSLGHFLVAVVAVLFSCLGLYELLPSSPESKHDRSDSVFPALPSGGLIATDDSANIGNAVDWCGHKRCIRRRQIVNSGNLHGAVSALDVEGEGILRVRSRSSYSRSPYACPSPSAVSKQKRTLSVS